MFLNGLCSVPESVLTTTFRYLCACNLLPNHRSNRTQLLVFFVQLAREVKSSNAKDVALKYEASSFQLGGWKQSEGGALDEHVSKFRSRLNKIFFERRSRPNEWNVRRTGI